MNLTPRITIEVVGHVDYDTDMAIRQFARRVMTNGQIQSERSLNDVTRYHITPRHH